MDSDDPEYASLPAAVKATLATNDSPDDAGDSILEPLIHVGIRKQFMGVTNEYLERRLARLGRSARVEGAVEVLLPCPCCGWRTIVAHGKYDICRVCFWEDDGTRDPDALSGPNHMSLREARANFERLGAMREDFVQYVLPDGKDRYLRDEPSGA